MKQLLLVTFDPELAHGARGAAELEQIKAAERRIVAAIEEQGSKVTNCRIDFGETAETVLSEALLQGRFDYVLIGTGIRTGPQHTVLFEQLVNTIHRLAPAAKFVFNASRDETAEAAARALRGGGETI